MFTINKRSIFMTLTGLVVMLLGSATFLSHTAVAAEQKNLAVYVRDANLPKVTDEHLRMTDRLVIAFARIATDGTLTTSNLTNFTTASVRERIRSVNPNMKLILSIGGGNTAATDEFVAMASDPAARQKFVTTVVQAIHDYGLDGVDLDWEYPRGSQQAITISLLQELRAGIDAAAAQDGRTYTLSMIGSAGQWFVNQNQLGNYHRYLDLISIVTYDMRGFGSFRDYTGHHAGLYTSPDDPLNQSADTAVRNYIAAGVPSEKIAIGAAFYSRHFAGIADVNNGLFQSSDPTKSRGEYFVNYDVLERDYINKNGYTRYWDDQAKAPYLYSPAAQRFVTYDDAESVRYKADYTQVNNLAGVMLWEYLDMPSNPLLASLNAGLHPATTPVSPNVPVAPTVTPTSSSESSRGVVSGQLVRGTERQTLAETGGSVYWLVLGAAVGVGFGVVVLSRLKR